MRFLKAAKILKAFGLAGFSTAYSVRCGCGVFLCRNGHGFYGDLPLYQQRLQQLLTQYGPWLHSFVLISSDTIKT